MGIQIKNIHDSDEFNHSLVILNGEIISFFQVNDKISIHNELDNKQYFWPVRKSHFKILITLFPGTNKFCLKCRNHSLNLMLIYAPLKNTRQVRLVYIKCKDSDGRFQAPPNEDNSIESACNRITLTAQMLQMFTAEKLAEHNFVKKTFCLEENEIDGKPVCHVFTSVLTTEEALSLSEEELWNYFAKELMVSSLADKNRYKFLAFVSFTRYNNPKGEIPQTFQDVLKLTNGHVALGGGGLALFGTGCLHTWAANLQEVVQRFTDQRIIDRRRYMDDSGNRKSYWACYSTGIGAALHELGHTFDLGHSSDGIMGRGFDDLYKVFTMESWPKGFFSEQVNVQLSTITNVSWSPGNKSIFIQNESPKVILLKQNESHVDKPLNLPHLNESDSSDYLCKSGNGAFWSRSSAVILNFHKWLNPTFPAECCQPPILNGSDITSLHGIRIIEFRSTDGMSYGHWEFLQNDGVMEKQLNHVEMLDILPSGCIEFDILVEDNFGNILKSRVKTEDCS